MSLLRRAADRALDATIALSFDRSGFERHRRGFVPGELDVDLSGRVCLVTGANSGIGRATARALAARGARVRLLCRSAERGEEALGALREETGGELHLDLLDVSDLAAVRAYAARLDAPEVHVLVHNAGVLPDTLRHTRQGLELTLATNLVGPTLLTELLLPRMPAGARVLHVTSGGMYTQRLDVEALHNEDTPFDGVVAYARTKRAQVVLSACTAARLAPRGVVVNAMHPGWADTPAVRTSLPRFHALTRPLLRTPEQGADTLVWLAAARRAGENTGKLWFDRAPRPEHLVPWTREPEGEARRLLDQLARWTDAPSVADAPTP